MREMMQRTCLISALSAMALQAQAPPKWPEFVSALNAYAATDSIVGAAALYMKDGKVVARHELGWGDKALGQRVDTNTIFHWGSITKTLTAIAVMQQVRAGKLSLDAKVTAFIPELRRVHAAEGSMDDITVRMLLGHSSGLQGGTWPYTQGRDWEPFEPTTWAQLVAMMPYQQLAFKPDARYSYSNPAFVYLARIVEEITGDPWEAYVQKNIFSPLGLTRSYFNSTPLHLAQYRSNNYFVVKDSLGPGVRVVAQGRDFNPGITIPNGGWNAPLGDLARYLAFLSGAAVDVPTRGEPGARGEAATRALYETILPHAMLEQMWEPRFTATGSEWMGLSFFIDRGLAPGEKLIGHTGSQAAFRAFVYVNPATKAAVIVAYNSSNRVDIRAAAANSARMMAQAKALLR
jgi:CubicO group peptidase (beta-lactamase class C family)